MEVVLLFFRHFVFPSRRGKPINIRSQFLIYIVASLLILVSLATYTKVVTQKTIGEIHTEYAQTICQDFNTEITLMNKQLDSTFLFLHYNSAVQALISSESYRSIPGQLIDNVDMAIATASQLNNSVSDIALYNGTISYSKLYEKENLRAMTELLPQDSVVTCLGIQKPVAYHKEQLYLTFGQRIYSDCREIGAVFISINLDYLFQKLPSGPDRAFLLWDQAGQVYTSQISDNLTAAAEQILTCTPQELLVQTPNIPGYMLYVQSLPEVRSTLIGIIDTGLHQGDVHARVSTSYVLILLFLIFSLGSALVFFRNYLRPIHQLNEAIVYIRYNPLCQLEEPLQLQGCAEIQTIGDNLTQMLSSLNEMNEKVKEASEQLYKMEIAKQNAEIAYLRLQINPHFLYNTLELIRASAENGDNKTAVSATVCVGKILRYSVKGGATAPLKEEIEVIRAYVSIQQARRNTPVTTIYSIPASVQQIPVMKMILQPLVENAFLHGLASRQEDAVLFISASRSGNKLCISIRDNGGGIDPETLHTLQAQLHDEAPDTSSHLGLCNTHTRIRLQYGPPYGVELSSAPGDGTHITLTLPADF